MGSSGPHIVFVVRNAKLSRFVSPILKGLARASLSSRITVLTTDPGFEQWRVAFPEVGFEKIKGSKSPLNRGTRAMRSYLHWVHLGKHNWSFLSKYMSSFPEDRRGLISTLHTTRLSKVLALAPYRNYLRSVEERSPPEKGIVKQLRELAPDFVLATPAVFPNSVDVDYIKACRAEKITCAALIPSWDNLTTKGVFHNQPNHVFVWNDTQRTECMNYHMVPVENVVMCGAPTFDPVYARQGLIPREEFCAEHGLPVSEPFVLWAASSMGGRDESSIVKALASRLGDNMNILVRPHPNYGQVWQGLKLGKNVFFSNGSRFAEDEDSLSAIVNAVHHSSALVGLSTSMFLEAAILDRPSALIHKPAHGTDYHTSYIHFEYLLESGFVEICERESDMAEWLKKVVPDGDGKSQERRNFAREFLRPQGEDRAAADVTAETILKLANQNAARN